MTTPQSDATPERDLPLCLDLVDHSFPGRAASRDQIGAVHRISFRQRKGMAEPLAYAGCENAREAAGGVKRIAIPDVEHPCQCGQMLDRAATNFDGVRHAFLGGGEHDWRKRREPIRSYTGDHLGQAGATAYARQDTLTQAISLREYHRLP